MTEQPKYKIRARELRQKMTEEEFILWEKLRNRRFFNLKFLRQNPVIYDTFYCEPLFFIADFYCAEKKVIIEVDGKIHDFRKSHDNDRDNILRQLNLNVLRIRNEEFKNIQVVMDKIRSSYLIENSPPAPLCKQRGVPFRNNLLLNKKIWN
jgi:very-short-patch-repair endonuclease